jgi:hypothetical protein
VALGRLREVLALAGIGITVGVLLVFVFAARLRGSSPLGVALTGGIVIAVSTIYLAHGVSDRTTVALVGTIASLLLTAALGAAFGAAAHRPPRVDLGWRLQAAPAPRHRPTRRRVGVAAEHVPATRGPACRPGRH